MAVIKPSLNFEGSDLSSFNSGSIVRADVPSIDFKSDKAKQGLYLYILPPYKLDAAGNGVWFKVVKIRDNFGIDVKEKFPVQKNCPIDFFENKVKLLFPDYGKVNKVTKDGRDIKQYASYGRTTKRVLFNAAYHDAFEKGAHVLDIPQSGAAEVIDNFHRRVGPSGKLTQMINDPAGVAPVFFRLKPVAESKGNPWEVIIQSNERTPLPPELSDSDYLHNLDDVLVQKNPEELIEKLRMYTPNEIFEACMKGYSKEYSGKVTVPSAGIPAGPAHGVTEATPLAPKPASLNIPKIAKRPEPAAVFKPVDRGGLSGDNNDDTVEQEAATPPAWHPAASRKEMKDFLGKKVN